jgi:hypothetical protein
MLEKWTGLFLSFFLAMILLEVKMGHASILLPKPSFNGKVSVEKAIRERRTIRDFKQRILSLVQLSQLLWAAQGITDSVMGRRSDIPSSKLAMWVRICFSRQKPSDWGLGSWVHLMTWRFQKWQVYLPNTNPY